MIERRRPSAAAIFLLSGLSVARFRRPEPDESESRESPTLVGEPLRMSSSRRTSRARWTSSAVARSLASDPQLGQVRVRVARRQNGQLLEVRDAVDGRRAAEHMRGHLVVSRLGKICCPRARAAAARGADGCVG